MSASAIVLRAMAYVGLGRHTEVINDLDLIIEADAVNIRALAVRAAAYANLGQDLKARSDADRGGRTGWKRSCDKQSARGD